MPLSSPQHMGAQAMLGRMGMAGPNVLRSPTRDGGGLQMPGGGAPPGMFSGAVSHGRGRIMDDPLVSKRVKVCRGPYKGCGAALTQQAETHPQVAPPQISSLSWCLSYYFCPLRTPLRWLRVRLPLSTPSGAAYCCFTACPPKHLLPDA